MTFLGMDFGGTKVAFRTEYGTEGNPAEPADGPDGPDESVFRWPATRTVGDDLAALAGHTRTVLARQSRPVGSVGVSMPATLGPDGRVLTWPSRPFWQGVDLIAELTALLPDARIRCADDGDLAALAEADRAGCRDVVYLGVGTGVGGGIVLDGQLVPGPGRGSCEVGHIVVDRSGERCDCGRRGCVQAVASGPATLRRAAAGRGAPVEYAGLRDAFAVGESWAVEAIEESCAALAAAAVSLGELVRPQQVVVGGGFAAGIPGFVACLAAHTARLGRPGVPPPPVRAARLGGLSSLHGAVLLARGA